MTTLTNQEITNKVVSILQTKIFASLPTFAQYRAEGGKTGKLFFYKENNVDKVAFASSNSIIAMESEIANAIADAVNPLTTTTESLQTQINGIQSVLNADDINLDTVQEIVDYIKQVRSELDTILVNDLTTGGTTKALSAEQGKALKDLYDSLDSTVSNLATSLVVTNGNIEAILSSLDNTDMSTPIQI